MRIWSVHPKYLDSKGLVALWRESLLAKHVLEGRTKGYTNHPQLDRFKATSKPLNFINKYLEHVYLESIERGYSFDESKFDKNRIKKQLPVTNKQIAYEWKHLLQKLKVRDAEKYNIFKNLKQIEPHPLCTIITGEIENWERVQ